MFTYPARVVRVVDGDTVRVDVDLGFRTWLHDVSVRIARIDAPELKTVEGKVAREFAVGLLSAGEVTLTSHEWDKYGRVLGSLNINAGSQPHDFAEAMLHAGHAVPYSGGPR